MDRTDFQGTLGDQAIDLYSLTNENGLEASITNYGARLVELLVPDREGNMENIVVGYSSMNEFLDNGDNSFGAVIGRYANRIAQGRFTLNGKEYQLPKNFGNHHLHGGRGGFHNVIWGANQVDDHTLQLSYRSQDGEEGYPGNLGVRATYTLTNEDQLVIMFKAESDERTILNMSHHPYFNLGGAQRGASIDDHLLTIAADECLEVNKELIPTGKVVSVKNTPIDFRNPKSIGAERQADHPYLQYTEGYDHNLIIDREQERELHFAARAEDPATGRTIEIQTSEPGLQFYTCEHPVDQVESAFCLEPQHFPDAPNHDNFPSTVLEAYETYEWKTIFILNS